MIKPLLLLTISLLFFFQCSAQYFQKGYYVGLDKSIHPGLIAYENGSEFMFYMADEKSDEQELAAKEMVGFVTETDTFEVVTNFEIPLSPAFSPKTGAQLMGADSKRISAGFAKVIRRGEITLYRFHNYANGSFYLLRHMSSRQITQLPNSRKGFKQQAAEYFQLSSKISQDIRDGKLKFKHLPTIVERYNQERKHLSASFPQSVF